MANIFGRSISKSIHRFNSIIRIRQFSKNSTTMDGDWKIAIEKLLIPQHRAPHVDALVFTQQKYASVFCKSYRYAQSKLERRQFLTHLIKNFGRSNLKSVVLDQSDSDEKYLSDTIKLLKDAPPPYHRLFRAIGQVEDGIKFLVDLRADVLIWLREMQSIAVIPEAQSSSIESSTIRPTALKLMDVILRDLLSIWFSIGLLEVDRVTWQSSCDLLERIAQYETVHAIRSWTDLKHRVGPYRRCFVFTHPSVPREPLVVLHVALMEKIPEKIEEVIATRRADKEPLETEEDANEINTAIFYSINSTQIGLQGIDLGHFLIKRVARLLSSELPMLNAFSSLSPIPGFRKWLVEELRRRKKDSDAHHQLPLTPDELAALSSALESNQWFADETLREQLRPILLRICAYYLLRLKHRGHAYDPVANFHLRNGAMVWRLNWGGDPSPKGVNQSCSIMVNYRYYLHRTDEYSRSYLDDKEIHADEQVNRILETSVKSSL